MRTWSLPLGQVGNAIVRLHWSFLFLVAYLWIQSVPTLGADALSRSCGLGALMLGSIIAHEVAHGLVAMRKGSPQRVLVLMPIGGIALSDGTREQRDTGGDWLVAMVGPFTNFFLAFVGAAILLGLFPGAHLLVAPYVYAGSLLRSFFWFNLFVGILNLVPAYPSDGGRVFRAELSRRMDEMRATRRAVALGQFFAMAMILAGLWNAWLMVGGFFLFMAAQMEERSIIFQSVVENLRLEDVMLTDFATLSPADTLEDALSKAVHTLQEDFPVVRGSDMVGVVTRQKIVSELRAKGNGYVQSAMNRMFQVAQKRESLGSALRKLTGQGLSLIPVVDDGRLVGIVTFQNLMHSLRLLAESRKMKRDQAKSN